LQDSGILEAMVVVIFTEAAVAATVLLAGIMLQHQDLVVVLNLNYHKQHK